MPRKQTNQTNKLKQKTRKSAVKRFKITGTGKVLVRAQNMRHRRRHKTKRAIREGKHPIVLTGKWATKIKKMLGLA